MRHHEHCAASPLGNGYELSHGDQFTLTEDSEVWDQLCDPEYRDIECLLSIRVAIYEYFPEMDDYTWVGQLEDIEITVF